jgi:hypothetical protein
MLHATDIVVLDLALVAEANIILARQTSDLVVVVRINDHQGQTAVIDSDDCIILLGSQPTHEFLGGGGHLHPLLIALSPRAT